MSEKRFYRLSDDAIEVIEKSATPHKRGQWLSNAALAYATMIDGAADDQGTTDQRLKRIEALLIALLNRG